MKNISYKRYTVLFCLLVTLLSGCKKSDEDLNMDFSKFEKLNYQVSESDKWIKENLTDPYNIEILWRYEDIESDLGYNLIPPQEDNVVPFLNILRNVFIESYIEIFEGSSAYADKRDFIRTYVPKQFHLLGEWAYNSGGTIKLGQAEGGRKIILYGVNYWKDKERLTRFLHTIFHEFSHILHQNKLYSEEFEKVTAAGYTGQWFNPQDNEALRFKQSREQGFVSDYARMNKNEDFVETLTYYILLSDEGWAELLSGIDGSDKAKTARDNAKSEGKNEDEQKKIFDAVAAETSQTARAAITMKQEMIATYLKTNWDIDINHLKAIVQRRFGEAIEGLRSVDRSALQAKLDAYILTHGLTDALSGDQLSHFSCSLGEAHASDVTSHDHSDHARQ